MDRCSWRQKARGRRSRRRFADLLCTNTLYSGMCLTCGCSCCPLRACGFGRHFPAPVPLRRLFGSVSRGILLSRRSIPFTLLTVPLCTFATILMSTLTRMSSDAARKDPLCVPQHGPTLRLVVKALGSVKHEGQFIQQAAAW